MQRVPVRDQLLPGRFKLVPLGLQRGDAFTGIVAFGQQRRNLGFEIRDPGLRRAEVLPGFVPLGLKGRNPCFVILDPGTGRLQVVRKVVPLGRQGGDGRGLRLCLGLGIVERCAQLAKLAFQALGFPALQPQRLGERGHLGAEFVKLAFLAGNRLFQDELHDHEDRQHEHQHQQQAGHRVHEAGPDRVLEPVAGAP